MVSQTKSHQAKARLGHNESSIRRKRKRHVPATMRNTMSRRFMALAGSAKEFPYPPEPEAAVSGPKLELKREIFAVLSADIARQLKRRRASEHLILKDFSAWRKARRVTRRRR